MATTRTTPTAIAQSRLPPWSTRQARFLGTSSATSLVRTRSTAVAAAIPEASATTLRAQGPIAAGQPGALLRRIELAGGHLELVQWGPPPTAPSPATGPAPSPRLLRVWLPPGYYDGPVAGTTPADLAAADTPAATPTAITGPPPPSTLASTPPAAGLLPAPAPATPPPGGWPVLYLNGDTTVLQMARNVEMFDDRLSFSGHSWRVAQTASQLISSGVLPGFVVVGLDHAGARRSAEYTPVKPGTGPGGHRQDAAAWPGGEVDAYLDTVVQQVMPWAQQTYRVTNQAAKVAFGGSSFGAICTLCLCLRYPGLVGSTLIESPSCWIDEGRWFQEVLLKHRGPWPDKVWLAMGEAEHRGDPEAPLSRLLVGYATQLSQHLSQQGLALGQRQQLELGHKAAHTESAWAERLPRALAFLGAHWR
ncbi:Alpha/Beta hydrolase protein [Haematococcus lacustris]